MIHTTWDTPTHHYRLRLEQEDNPENPRTSWDCNAGTMVCWHDRYNLGDESLASFNMNSPWSPEEWTLHLVKKEGPERFFHQLAREKVSSNYPESLFEVNAEKIARKHYIILPLYLYDHSGITMSTGPFSCPWDSGQVGWIFMDRGKLASENWTEAQATKYLEGEVETYDQYLTGNVWGFIVERIPLVDDPVNMEPDEEDWEDPEEMESCWGFYGDDPNTNGMDFSPEYWIAHDQKEAAEAEQEETNKKALLLSAARDPS